MRDSCITALVILLFASAIAVAGDATSLPLKVAASDANIQWIGRWDTRDAGGPWCSWPGSSVLLRFEGTALNAGIDFKGQDRLQVVVDGEARAVIKPEKGQTLYRVAEGLKAGEHTVELVKRTEVFVGTTQIKGFEVEGKLLPPPARAQRRIEIVGDSISCGYGNEDTDANKHFSNDTENNYMAYGALAARAVKAEFVCVAWSGRKMWPDNTTPELWDRALGNDGTSKWDFSGWIADAVVINLATNDFGKGNPDEKGWTDAYKAFIARVRKAYPNAQVYCAAGTMMSDNYPPKQNARTTVLVYLNKIVSDLNQAGDKKVAVLDFGVQDIGKDGIGGDWHPSIKTHQKMAAKLTDALKKDLGW